MSELGRIAFLSEHASPLAILGGVDAGGQNIYVDEISRHLGMLGYGVDVFTRWDNPDVPEVLPWSANVRVINLQVGSPSWVFKDNLWPLMPAFRDAFLRFMIADGVRYDLVHANFWMSGWVAAELKRALGLPFVQIFHATGKTKQRHQGDADSSPSERIDIEMSVVQAADRVIAQCPCELQELLTEYDARHDHVVVIPSAVDTQRYRPVDRADARARVGLKYDELVVGYVGRMLPRKDVRNVVRAMALIPRAMEVRLMLVGGETEEPDPEATPEIGELHRLSSELGIADSVSFVGKRQPDELRYYYSAADVIVTTPWYEPFGLTPLEAMACGQPVVGSAVGGLTYTIADGVTGLLVPPSDPEALAAALSDLLSCPERRRQMGIESRRRVERKFTWPVAAKRTAALYEAVLNEQEQLSGIDLRAGVL